MTKRHLVKRRGHTEPYDEKKVYASVYAAALNAHLGEKESEKLAEQVMKEVHKKAGKAAVVDSEQIRDWILESLGGPDDDVGYLYLHHLDIN